ncbi:MAG TPA: citryl-CoA lyase [Pseudonocardia sp.]
MTTAAQHPVSQTVGDRILVRGRDLADELIGSMTFTEMFLFDLTGQVPTRSHVRIVDAVLVTLMEHGITPSTLAARLVIDGAPESTEGAVAAGLLAVGSRFLGVIEQVATVCGEICTADGGDLPTSARAFVDSARAAGTKVPGFGHNLHEKDPRVVRLLELADGEGAVGPHLRALQAVDRCLNDGTGAPLAMNAAGVIGALLADLGYGPSAIRGFGLVARSAGLLAHVVDERANPIARGVWQRAHESFGRDTT